MTEPPRKKIRANIAQTDHLINFMARNRQFALGLFTTPIGLQSQNAQWQTLALELAEIGPAKTVDQWKTSWRDLKSRAKANNAKANRALTSTGNMTEVPTLSAQDKLILGIIGKVTSQGLPGVPESPIGQAASSNPTTSDAPSRLTMETLPSENVSIVDDEQVSEEPQPSPSTLHQPQAGLSGLRRPHPTAGDTGLSSEGPLHPPFSAPSQPRSGPSGLSRPRLRPGTVADIYSAHSEEQTKILKEIASHLRERNNIEKERNNIEKERNKILQEKNQILALLLQQQPELGGERYFEAAEDDID